jgi:hypothetical protein
MADSGGHWLNLAEAQKLTQSELLSGVVDIAPKRNPLWLQFPVRQIAGSTVKWNRSNARGTASRMSIGDQLTWTDDITYTQVELSLAQFYKQSPLNKFVSGTYKSWNDYEVQHTLELRRSVAEFINDSLVYDNSDYTSNHMQGLHHWAVDNTGTNGDIDEGEGALSLLNVRTVLDYMKHGTDFMVMSFELARYIDQFYQEGGSQFGDTNVARPTMGRIIWSPDQQGMPTPSWAGVPLIRSDYLVSEQANTGAGSDARAKNSSGDAQYSILFVKRGAAQREMVDPGAIIHFGSKQDVDAQDGEFFFYERFNKLEDYDAAGVRWTSYMNLGVGSPLSICRIYDIELGIPTA